MPRNRRLLLLMPALGLTVASIASIALGGPASIADPSDAGTVNDGSDRSTRSDTSAAQEYVVTFDGDAQAARQQLTDAGGQVVDVVDQLGIALVRTRDDGFVHDVQSESAIADAALNHAVGVDRPGMSHRYAEEILTADERAELTGSLGSTRSMGAAEASRQESPESGSVEPPQTAGSPEPGETGGSPSGPAGPAAPAPAPAGPASPAGSSQSSQPPAGSASVPSGELVPPADRAGAGGSVLMSEESNDVLAEPGAATEPLADRQWDMAMIGATPEAAHQQATGAGVDVGIIDTGIDGNHPDIAPNFDRARSRNFTVDRPETDGPCESPNCVDPADVDDGGHGTHVAATVAAARNGFGMLGAAPQARLVNLRAGQDSGYFFVYEVAKALVAAGDMGLDVVNMSFFTDPWMYNCTSRGDYISGEVTEEELAQQKVTRDVVLRALEYAHDRGVTLIAAAGNEHTNLAAPQRVDQSSPGYPPGGVRPRTVRPSCLDLPNEGPNVISVGGVGPSGVKADYSNYGAGRIELSAPGGWLRDQSGSSAQKDPANLVLSAFPQDVAVEQALAGPDGQPADAFSVRQCDSQGVCGFYTYMQGTSMAAPHVTGVAALIIQRFGEGSPQAGYRLDPNRVAHILTTTAEDRPCPPEGTQRYTEAGRDEAWAAVCQGSPTANGLYGEGIVDAAAAVQVPGD